ncbi:hypothetical protein ABM000_02875 [Morganella morganii]|nr:hypothetical protein [Morganella morganii]EBN0073228.1 hypothetical protein [Salmonella enterica subsp. enterica serovar Virchow]BEP20117.1 hypothetical protein SUGSMm_09140 [Morganella morganii subsp. sibonii]ELO7538758.1 hypothetical protein [Morganella morganii]UEH04771.1 hypothetical protein LLY23_04460 [Morganella morganii]HAU5616747.1 hypothetical protein [Morganella morganii]
MNTDFKDAVLVTDAQASIEERQLNSIKMTVQGLINFVITSFEQLGIDKLHELTDPSLDELAHIIQELGVEAKKHQDINLQQTLLIAEMLINDIKMKNPEMCANSSHMLKKANIF